MKQCWVKKRLLTVFILHSFHFSNFACPCLHPPLTSSWGRNHYLRHVLNAAAIHCDCTDSHVHQPASWLKCEFLPHERARAGGSPQSRAVLSWTPGRHIIATPLLGWWCQGADDDNIFAVGLAHKKFHTVMTLALPLSPGWWAILCGSFISCDTHLTHDSWYCVHSFWTHAMSFYSLMVQGSKQLVCHQ